MRIRISPRAYGPLFLASTALAAAALSASARAPGYVAFDDARSPGILTMKAPAKLR